MRNPVLSCKYPVQTSIFATSPQQFRDYISLSQHAPPEIIGKAFIKAISSARYERYYSAKTMIRDSLSVTSGIQNIYKPEGIWSAKAWWQFLVGGQKSK